jgi:hypothetical protein
MMIPRVRLNDILVTISRIRSTLDKLRKRESGTVQCPASDFPHSLNLGSFAPGDTPTVVATGWLDDGERLHPIAVHTRVTSELDGQVLTLAPHGPDGQPVRGEAMVEVSWIAMA